ncbi:MAG: hypothetical protein OS130_15115 [Thermodesulfobacteriota bacterium]|jgi:hypothetical protein|nr:MAG: hypothetical protein OS130_15115 [Thermodesulfobacteriota bacterium]
MTNSAYVKITLLVALITLSVGGFLLHLRIHPFAQNSSNIVPVISCILSIMAVPLLFPFRKTISYGYVLNGFLSIIATVTMSHFAIVHWPSPATLKTIIFNTTFPDIVIVGSKFFIGKSLFDLETFGYDPDRARLGKTYRYPNMGWWLVHLVTVSTVYSLGNILWR